MKHEMNLEMNHEDNCLCCIERRAAFPVELYIFLMSAKILIEREKEVNKNNTEYCFNNLDMINMLDNAIYTVVKHYCPYELVEGYVEL